MALTDFAEGRGGKGGRRACGGRPGVARVWEESGGGWGGGLGERAL